MIVRASWKRHVTLMAGVCGWRAWRETREEKRREEKGTDKDGRGGLN